MARPKYKNNEIKAKEKIATAFWQLLSEKPYSKLSVAEICKKSSLNKNTFYYHYANLNDMAITLVQESLDKEFAAFLLSYAHDKTTKLPLSFVNEPERFKHICLIAGKNSHPLLQSTLKNSISDIWRKILNIDDNSFTKELQIIFEFSLGGILSVIAMNTKENSFSFTSPVDLAQLDFIQRLLKEIARIRN